MTNLSSPLRHRLKPRILRFGCCINFLPTEHLCFTFAGLTAWFPFFASSVDASEALEFFRVALNSAELVNAVSVACNLNSCNNIVVALRKSDKASDNNLVPI